MYVPEKIILLDKLFSEDIDFDASIFRAGNMFLEVN